MAETGPDSPPTTLRCPACGFENATTSVYCQDCGTRLVTQETFSPPAGHVAAVPAAAAPSAQPLSPTGRTIPPARTRPKIRSASSSIPPHLFRIFLGITLRTIVAAGIAAIIIQLFRPPISIPPIAAPMPLEVISNVRLAMRQAAQAGSSMNAPWLNLNSYLAGLLKAAPSSGLFKTSFERALLAPAPDGFTLYVERGVLGVDLWTTIRYHVAARSTGMALDAQNAAIGRISLPAWFTFAVEAMNGNLAEALSSELAILQGARSIQISPQQAHIEFSLPAQ